MKGIEQFLQVDAATLGALKYAGTWNASTNTPTLASGVGVQGQYYVVSVAGSTNLDGETNWQVGDWAVFNGSVWQKVDGGSTGLLTTLTVTGNTYLATTSGDVGIGTSSPAQKLDVANGFVIVGANSANPGVGGNVRLRDDTGAARWLSGLLGGAGATAYSIYDIVAGAERLNISSTGDVGIGTSSPAQKLHVVGAGDVAQFTNGTRSAYLALDSGGYSLLTGAGQTGNGVYANATSNFVQLFTNGTAKATLDSSGNLGLGVTPSAWSGIGKTLQIDTGGSFSADSANAYFAANAYYNGTNWIYQTTNNSSRYNMTGTGQHQWFTAPSGTAGNAISFTQAMTLDASGNLGVGTSSPGARLHINSGGVDEVARFEGSGEPFISLYDNGVRDFYLFDSTEIRLWGQANKAMVFATNNNERMRLDSSGNLLVGTTTGAARIISAVADGTYSFGAVGTTKAIRISHSSTASKIEGVDSTLSASYQPLELNGSYLSFETSGAERARIDASGSLGVGVTDPDAPVTIQANSGANAIRIRGRATGNLSYLVFRNNANNADLGVIGSGDAGITFDYGGTERARIDSSGNLLVGTTSTSALTAFTGSAGGQVIQSGVPVLALVDSDDTTNGVVWLANSSGVGYLYTKAANPFVFGTNNTERARITSSGDLLVGTTTATVGTAVGCRIVDSGSRLEVASAASTNSDIGLSQYSTGAAEYRFYVGYGGTIYATNTTISAISDQRFKENVRDLDVGLNAIMALKPRKFDWKAGKGKDIKDDRGFIAQELEQVFPDLVDEWKDPAPEGEEPYKSVRQDLIPVLVKAIQELKAEVDSLKAQLGA